MCLNLKFDLNINEIEAFLKLLNHLSYFHRWLFTTWSISSTFFYVFFFFVVVAVLLSFFSFFFFVREYLKITIYLLPYPHSKSFRNSSLKCVDVSLVFIGEWRVYGWSFVVNIRSIKYKVATIFCLMGGGLVVWCIGWKKK